MTHVRWAWSWLVRARFVVLTLTCALVFYVRYSLQLNDFFYLEYFGRTLLHRPHFPGGLTTALHVYTDLPRMQIGPPATLSAFPLQLISKGRTSNEVAAAVMMAGFLPVLWLLERIAVRSGAAAERARSLVLVGGLAILPAWEDLTVHYMHWDDVLIVLLALGAILALQRRGWMLGAVLLGTAVATKPWAIALTPLLLLAPRGRLPRIALVWTAATLLWWVPFLIAAPRTFVELGSVNVPVQPGSVYYLLHLRGVSSAIVCQDPQHCLLTAPHWMRTVQLVLSALVAALVVRRGRWMAAPMVGLLARVLLDPQVWPYYGVGPLLMAFVWDLSRGRRVPGWTIAVGVGMYSSVVTGSTTVQAVLKLVVGVGAIAWFARPCHPDPSGVVDVPSQRDAQDDSEIALNASR